MNNYAICGEEFLAHHGILGQKWGKRNGPPYPLDPEDHSKAEKDAAKKRTGMSDETKQKLKKAAIIGAAVVGTALVTYGAYKLYSNRGMIRNYTNLGKKNIDFIRNSGKFDYLNIPAGNVDDLLPNDSSSSFISEEAKKISEATGLKLKEHAYTVSEDIKALRESRNKAIIAADSDEHYRNDCGKLLVNFVLRRKGLDCDSVGMKDFEIGGLSPADLGHYVKGAGNAFKDIEYDKADTAKIRLDKIKNLINEQCGSDDNCCGGIYLEAMGRHFTTWAKEDGKIIFDDIQSDQGSSWLVNQPLERYTAIKVARLDNKEIVTRNLLGSKVDSSITQVTKNRK